MAADSKNIVDIISTIFGYVLHKVEHMLFHVLLALLLAPSEQIATRILYVFRQTLELIAFGFMSLCATSLLWRFFAELLVTLNGRPRFKKAE